MWVEDLSAREQALYQMLFIPAPDYEAIAKKVVECSYTSDEITRATIGYLSNCVYEEHDSLRRYIIDNFGNHLIGFIVDPCVDVFECCIIKGSDIDF